ncbi:MAG TPA: hypothetical protein VGF20_08080 [Candidatus Acidoferrum sp.]|jgi:hypothetical protein
MANNKKKSPATKQKSKSPDAQEKATQFRDTFAALKKILKPYETRSRVSTDKPDEYMLLSTTLHKGKPLYFAGVRAGKAYVSFHLVPLYMNAALAKTVSPALKKRMQGKACFNFTSPDAQLFRELAELSAKGFASLHGDKFVSNMGKRS